MRVSLGLLTVVALMAACSGKPAPVAQARALCRYETLGADQPALFPASVEAKAPIQLMGDQVGCPSKTASCPRSDSVAPGEVVLVGNGLDDYACIYKTGEPYRSSGWLPISVLRTMPALTTANATRWAGAWQTELGLITIAGPGPFRVEGKSGQGASKYRRPRWAQFRGEGIPSGDTMAVVDRQCRVTLRLVGEFLVAADNHQCSDLALKMDDIYWRAKK
jgi:hypothetical protein